MFLLLLFTCAGSFGSDLRDDSPRCRGLPRSLPCPRYGLRGPERPGKPPSYFTVGMQLTTHATYLMLGRHVAASQHSRHPGHDVQDHGGLHPRAAGAECPQVHSAGIGQDGQDCGDFGPDLQIWVVCCDEDGRGARRKSPRARRRPPIEYIGNKAHRK